MSCAPLPSCTAACRSTSGYEEKGRRAPGGGSPPRRASGDVCDGPGDRSGLLLTWSQLRIAENGEERARRAEPLAYTLETVDSKYLYEIRTEQEELSIPAPSLRLEVTHGSLHTLTAILFDGTEFQEIAVLPIQDSWTGAAVDITMPAGAAIRDGDLVYDYFFLFLEPAEGENRLDLVCSTISLDTCQVETSVYRPIALAQLDTLPEGPQREMLSAYSALRAELAALGLLAP